MALTFVKSDFLDLANFLMFLVFDRFLIFLPITIPLTSDIPQALGSIVLLKLSILVEKVDKVVLTIKVSDVVILLKFLMNY